MALFRSILALSLLCAGPSLSRAAETTPDPIYVGVTVAQSPPGSVIQGSQILDALEVTTQYINDAGGIGGRSIELIVEDTQGMPDGSRGGVERLITRDKVVAIVGEHQSSNVLAGMEVAHRYGVPYINTNGWADAIREKAYREVFSPNIYNKRVATALASTIKTLGAKRVVAFAENSDYGRGLNKDLEQALRAAIPTVEYTTEILDRSAKDFQLPFENLNFNPPDVLVNMTLPPAAYAIIKQARAGGIAPGSKTVIYDASGVADYPDFWYNVKDAGNRLLVFGLYHPKMELPLLAKVIGEYYTRKTGAQPNRLLYQAADSLFVLADALKRSKGQGGEPLIAALEATKFVGMRGEIKFSSEPGATYHQWVDVPYVNYQFTAVGQKVADAPLLEQAGRPLDIARLQKPQ